MSGILVSTGAGGAGRNSASSAYSGRVMRPVLLVCCNYRSEAQSCRQLERARASRSEDAACGGNRLAEAGGVVRVIGVRRQSIRKTRIVEIADAENVGHVEDVEGLADQVEVPALPKLEGAAKAEVKRIEAVVEMRVIANLGQDDVA